jgi:hypothetical protein
MAIRTGDCETWAKINSFVQLDGECFLEDLIIELVMENNGEILSVNVLICDHFNHIKFGLIKQTS